MSVGCSPPSAISSQVLSGGRRQQLNGLRGSRLNCRMARVNRTPSRIRCQCGCVPLVLSLSGREPNAHAPYLARARVCMDMHYLTYGQAPLPYRQCSDHEHFDGGHCIGVDKTVEDYDTGISTRQMSKLSPKMPTGPQGPCTGLCVVGVLVSAHVRRPLVSASPSCLSDAGRAEVEFTPVR